MIILEIKKSEALQYLRNLKCNVERMEKTEKLDARLEQKLRSVPKNHHLYDAVDYFSEVKDFPKTAEIYQTLFALYNLAASKSENEEFRQWAWTQASLFKEKALIERTATDLRQDAAPQLDTHEVPSIKRLRKLETFPYALREAPLREIPSFPLETERPIEVLLEEMPISKIPDVIRGELEEIVGPIKDKVLNKILLMVFKRLDISAKTDYPLEMKIGPNVAKFRVDIALFDESNNLQAIIETVSNLTLRRAQELSLRFLKIKEENPTINLFVVFINGTSNAIEFMKPIVDGIYSVNDINVLLEREKNS